MTRSTRLADNHSLTDLQNSSCLQFWHLTVQRGISPWVVWGVYAICLAVAIQYVYRNAVNVPFGDDHYFVERSMGLDVLDWSWLWSQHNEHRLPLSRLILLGAAKLSGNDFRAGSYVVLTMLGVLAASLVMLARRIRGCYQWTDAMFPLACLHLGHCENLLWSFQVQFAGSVLIFGLLLVMLLRNANGLGTRREVLILGALSIGLVGFGANGIVFIPFIIIWIVVGAWIKFSCKTDGSRIVGMHMVLCGVVIAFVLVIYFAGFKRIQEHPLPPSTGRITSCVAQFLSLGVVPFALQYWPDRWYLIACLVPTALLMSCVRLVYVYFKKPAERLRIFGLFLMFAGLFALALGIAWGRSGFGDMAGFAQRYVTLSVPSLFLVYFTVLLYSTGYRSLILQTALCGVAVFTYLPHYDVGQVWITARMMHVREYEQYLRSGVRVAVIADRFADDRLHPQRFQIHHSPDTLANWILGLRRVGVGPFHAARADGDSRVEVLDVRAAIPHDLKWSDEAKTAVEIKTGAKLFFQLPQPKYIQRVYLTQSVQPLALSPPIARIFLVVSSSTADGSPQFIELSSDGTRSKLTLSVDREIVGFYLLYDSPPKSVTFSGISVISGRPG